MRKFNPEEDYRDKYRKEVGDEAFKLYNEFRDDINKLVTHHHIMMKNTHQLASGLLCAFIRYISACGEAQNLDQWGETCVRMIKHLKDHPPFDQ